jgi:hypothetical protein
MWNNIIIKTNSCSLLSYSAQAHIASRISHDKGGINTLLMNFMEQSPNWEADGTSDSQQIHCLLWNPKINYCLHNRPSLVPVLNQINFILSSFKINFNIIFPSTLTSPKWSPPSRCVALPWIHHMNNI